MIESVDSRSPNAPHDFCQSLRNTGFAILAYPPIDVGLVQRVYAGWFDFFQHGDTRAYLFDRATHDGFIPIEQSETAKGHQIADLKEMYHYYPHGRCPESLKSHTQRLFDQLLDLASTLLQWIERDLSAQERAQLSEPLHQMIQNSHHHLLRLLHYPPLSHHDRQSGAIRAQAHEDINLLTLLPAATAKGLQVQLASGQWLDIDPQDETLIVNIGDMLNACTQGAFRATTHRVINPPDSDHQSRLSMPLFLHPRDEVILSPRYTAQTYRAERFKELGLA